MLLNERNKDTAKYYVLVNKRDGTNYRIYYTDRIDAQRYIEMLKDIKSVIKATLHNNIIKDIV